MARVTDEKPVPVGLSTASVWPLKAGTAFELAAELGYDGVEVMVWADPVSQDVSALRRGSRRTGVPVLSIHSPSLLITQRIWSPDPVVRLRMSVDAALELGARTVVVHPPFGAGPPPARRPPAVPVAAPVRRRVRRSRRRAGGVQRDRNRRREHVQGAPTGWFEEFARLRVPAVDRPDGRRFPALHARLVPHGGGPDGRPRAGAPDG